MINVNTIRSAVPACTGPAGYPSRTLLTNTSPSVEPMMVPYERTVKNMPETEQVL